MTRIEFERLKPEHAAIAPYLRQADADEIMALSGLAPAVAVAYSIAHTQRGFAALLDGKPAAIFGISDDLIWLVGTDEITKHPITFFRETRRHFHELTRGYNYLHNCVDARNKLHLRWLKWLGFEIEDAQALGVKGRLFHKVIYKTKQGDKHGIQI